MAALKMCPCCSGQKYGECCGPLLEGRERAATAEALMRSRYSAYVRKDIAYVLATWHGATRPAEIDPASVPVWTDLRIVRVIKGAAGDAEGEVEFIATAALSAKPIYLHEKSRFVREAGCWLYVGGEVSDLTAPGAGKTGRNEPCPCGSGKKYKKCCAR